VRVTLWGLAAIAVIGAIIFFVAPLLISADDLRDRLFAQVEAATGYRLSVSGPIAISVFPPLDLVAEDVGIAQTASVGTTQIATAKKLRFNLTLAALLNGRVKVTEVTLIDPVITLPEAKSQAKAEAGGAKETGAEGSPAASALKSLSLDRLVIRNGTLILPGSGGAQGKRIEALTLEASLPAFDAPLSFDVTAIFEGKAVHAAGSIDSFGRFLDGEATPISLAVEAPAYTPEKIALAGTATYSGAAFALNRFTLRAGDRSLAGNAAYKGNILTLNPITAKAGGNTLAGAVSANLSGEVPYLAASLSGRTLDLNTMLSGGGDAGASAGGGGAASGWSDAKIDFSPLRALNAKLKLSVEQLVYNQIKTGPIGLQATISGGKLTAELPSFKLYNGAGKGTLAVDASGKTPTQVFRLSLANLDAYSFLKDIAGFQSLEGTGAIAIDLNASGASQRAIVSALNGTAKLEFTEGAVRGINIAKTVRSLTTGIVSGWQSNDAEKTDFASLGASFKVARGQAQTGDLHLSGPLVRMTGAGNVDLPGRTLKFRVDPQLVASLEGQGGKSDLAGLGVPIMIAGPWAKPSIYPDIAGILNNPVAAYEQLSKLGGGLVALPGASGLAEKVGSTGAIANIIQDGKVNPGALQQGLGQLLGNQTGADQAPVADEQQLVEPVPVQPKAKSGKAKQKPVADGGAAEGKKGKKRSAQADARPKPAPEEAAAQFMQNFLGN
jgi:AsmA protein